MQFREKEQCELKKKENREIKRYIDIYSKGMYILFLYISSIYEKSKQSSFLGSPNGLDRFCFCQRNEGLAPSECFSDSEREENKMQLPLPLSFSALLIFPSNAGRA